MNKWFVAQKKLKKISVKTKLLTLEAEQISSDVQIRVKEQK